MTASSTSDSGLGGSGRSCRYQAHIIGTASFMISEGWKRTSPRSSQRCAPLPMAPMPATTKSSRTPTRYSHGDSRRRKLGFTWASSNIATVPMPRWPTWRITVPRLWPEAL